MSSTDRVREYYDRLNSQKAAKMRAKRPLEDIKRDWKELLSRRKAANNDAGFLKQ